MTTGEKIVKLLSESLIGKLIAAAIVVLIALFIYRLIVHFLKTRYEKVSAEMADSARTRTFLKLARSVVRYALILFIVITLLSIFGVDISSMLTGVGIFAVIAGFIVQDALKDIIRGATILSDKYFSIGDVVVYGGITGEVVSFGLVSTKIRDLDDNSVLAVANRNIVEIKVLTELQLLRLPLPYDEDDKKLRKIMTDIAEKIKEQPNM